jgi:hypothetical protein
MQGSRIEGALTGDKRQPARPSPKKNECKSGRQLSSTHEAISAQTVSNFCVNSGAAPISIDHFSWIRRPAVGTPDVIGLANLVNRNELVSFLYPQSRIALDLQLAENERQPDIISHVNLL